jgi:transposase-like protein
MKLYHPNPQELEKEKTISLEKQQLKEAQKKIRDLEEENAILKKAAAIFIKHPR